jgi:hypothetical protein
MTKKLSLEARKIRAAATAAAQELRDLDGVERPINSYVFVGWRLRVYSHRTSRCV